MSITKKEAATIRGAVNRLRAGPTLHFPYKFAKALTENEQRELLEQMQLSVRAWAASYIVHELNDLLPPFERVKM